VSDRHNVHITLAARRDIAAILKRSEREFGKDAALRYEALLAQALRDIATDPERPGSRERPELAKGSRAYHLFFSRDRARTDLGVVHNPRHFLIYRRNDSKTVIEILRVIHDSRDLLRQTND
jgi:toxin ParE1/3/4